MLDIILRDDEYRVRTVHAPANLTTIRHMACNPLRYASGKHSMRMNRKAVGWNNFVMGLITG